MNKPSGSNPSIGRPLNQVRRKALDLSGPADVDIGPLEIHASAPLLVQARQHGMNLCAWSTANHQLLLTALYYHGALLFRHFDPLPASGLESMLCALSGEPLEYTERSSPRRTVEGRIYTSTEYPADQKIFFHNENSYANVCPQKLFFGCLVPASSGGETPLADCRRVYQRIPRELRRRCEQRGILYVRNFHEGLGMPWQQVFRTTDKEVLQRQCRDADYEIDWVTPRQLRTRRRGPAVLRHPISGVAVWFNHATFFHPSSLPACVRDTLLQQFELQNMPNYTSYGDGTPFGPGELDEFRQAYEAEAFQFSWETGDVLWLDNLLMAHGRNPYSGPRRIVVGMAEPYRLTHLI